MNGEALVKMREELGLSQAALAERLGISRMTMRKYERSTDSLPSYIELAIIGIYSLRRKLT